jgi:putative hydroxymethylpyrimidine transport system substrate-binding protein
MRLSMRTLASIFFLLIVTLAAPTANAAERVTLILDWFVNPDHAPLVVSKAKGFFAAEGLDVELVAPADPNDPPKLVAAGKGDVAITYQPQLHLQVAQGLPLVRIATLVAMPLSSLVVLNDGPVDSIASLRGRRIGFSVGGFEDVLLAEMLQRHGLKPADVTLINVNFALSPALLSGQVDAVIGAFRNFELNQLAIEGRPGRAFYPEEEGVPAYDELIVVAHRDRLADPRLARLVSAIERGILSIVNHPEESWRAFLSSHPDLDDELNRRAWRDTLTRFARRPAALDRGRYQRFASFLQSRGLIPSVPPLDTYARQLD